MDSGKKLFTPPVASVCDMGQINATFSSVFEAVSELVDALKNAIDSIFNSEQFCDTMAALVAELQYIPKEKPPRPPKYAGIKNKARTWTPAPARVARSNLHPNRQYHKSR